MKSAIVFLLIVAFMTLSYFLNKGLQKIIKPRLSFIRLLFYFLSVMILVFIVTFTMVFIIAKLYPDELIK